MLRRTLAVVFAAMLATALPSAALATTPDPTPADTSPPATEAPSQPAPTEPAAPGTTEPGTGDDGEGVDLLPILLIVAGVVVLLVVLGALFGRSKQPAPRRAAAPSRAPRTPSSPSPQASLLSTAQWIHDQLSLELMGANPTVAAQRWATERSRLDNVAIGAQAQFSNGADPNWQGFGQSVSSLATALDTNLQLRAHDPPSAELINESTDVVNRNRSVLQQWINALQPTIER